MKKKILLSLLAMSAGQLRAAAYDYADLIKQLATKTELELDTAPGVRSGRITFKLPLEAKDPLTGKTFRVLITDAWKQDKPYKLAQFLSFEPVVPSYDDDRRKRSMDSKGRTYNSKEELRYIADDVLYSFVDHETAFGEKEGLDPTTAIDKNGTNLEIEQILVWKIPYQHYPHPFEFVNAELARDVYEAGFWPMHPENPEKIALKDMVALIDPAREVISSWEDPKNYPYLVDVVPLSETEFFSGRTFSDLIQGRPEEQGEDDKVFRIARVSTWDAENRKAHIAYYDADEFEPVEDQWPDLFKVQIFDIDPKNPNRAYLTREKFSEGFYPRGKFNMQDKSFKAFDIPGPQTEDDTVRRGYSR